MGNPTDTHIIVDGFNLLHAVVLSGRDRGNWWRAENQLRVLELAAHFESVESFRLTVVFDAARQDSQRCLRPAALPAAIRLVFAPNADEWILQQARAHGLGELVVVTADRSLGDRAKRIGASRMSPWVFAERCQRA